MEYSIGGFVDRLMEEKGIQIVSDDIQEQLKSDLVDRIEDMINATILSNMPENRLADFEQLLESGTDSEIQEFCKTHIDQFDTVIAGAFAQFRQSYLGVMN